MSDETTVNTKGLDQLLKALKGRPPVARIGILGDSPRASAPSEISHLELMRKRTKPKGAEINPTTNATVGAAHEFGTSRLPQRSFLRVPISENLEKQMENSGALDNDALADVIKAGSVIPWLKKITAIAEGIVAEAFDTGGFGKWPAWKTKGYTNNTGDILVDTQQLRNSISSEVK